MVKHSYKKILFCDIDGVLNRCEYVKDLYFDTYGDHCLALHKPAVLALKKLLEEVPDLNVVWISDWNTVPSTFQGRDGCTFNPMSLLESFDWLKCRIAGRVVGKMSMCRIESIIRWLNDNIVENFAIADDNDIYPYDGQYGSWLTKNLVLIDNLKAFNDEYANDVKKKLDMPFNKEYMMNVIHRLNAGDSFTMNDKYVCTFVKNHDANSLFSEWAKEDNCNATQFCKASVAVVDRETNDKYEGYVTLMHNTDIITSSAYSINLSLKKDDAVVLNTTASTLTDIVQNFNN